RTGISRASHVETRRVRRRARRRLRSRREGGARPPVDRLRAGHVDSLKAGGGPESVRRRRRLQTLRRPIGADLPETATSGAGPGVMKKLAIALAMLVAFGLAFALTPPRGPRSLRQFQPARLADLEVRMWQAYYAKERVRLFTLLTKMLREQYHY